LTYRKNAARAPAPLSLTHTPRRRSRPVRPPPLLCHAVDSWCPTSPAPFSDARHHLRGPRWCPSSSARKRPLAVPVLLRAPTTDTVPMPRPRPCSWPPICPRPRAPPPASCRRPPAATHTPPATVVCLRPCIIDRPTSPLVVAWRHPPSGHPSAFAPSPRH
jgi:hypothetical protein